MSKAIVLLHCAHTCRAATLPLRASVDIAPLGLQVLTQIAILPQLIRKPVLAASLTQHAFVFSCACHGVVYAVQRRASTVQMPMKIC